MPLLAFKYLPIRGGRLEAFRVNLPLREAQAECRILDDVRESVVTIHFRRVSAIHVQLGSSTGDPARIVGCFEEAGVFRITMASGDQLQVSAAGYDVQ